MGLGGVHRCGRDRAGRADDARGDEAGVQQQRIGIYRADACEWGGAVGAVAERIVPMVSPIGYGFGDDGDGVDCRGEG